MIAELDRFEERSGALFLRKLVPRIAAPRPLLWLHGAGEHGGRHETAAAHLARRGFEVWLPDLPGYGRSAGHATPREMRALLVESIAGAAKKTRFDVFGHSFGGLLAIGLVRESTALFRRCALSAPFLAPARAIPRWKRCAGRVAARVRPTLRFSMGYAAEDLLRDPEEQSLWLADPLRRRGVEARFGAALLDEAAERCAEQTPLPRPCLVLLAADDRVASSAAARAWAERCGAAKVELAHFRHEILREPERGLALMALVRWFEQD